MSIYPRASRMIVQVGSVGARNMPSRPSQIRAADRLPPQRRPSKEYSERGNRRNADLARTIPAPRRAVKICLLATSCRMCSFRARRMTGIDRPSRMAPGAVERNRLPVVMLSYHTFAWGAHGRHLAGSCSRTVELGTAG
jgi:hypothetical protein